MGNRRWGGFEPPVLALLLASTAALAQEKLNFDIPAQPAAAAIQLWAQQSGLQVFAADEHLRGVRTNPVRGDYTALEAAQLLIAGTGLEVVSTGDKTVTIRRPSSGQRPASADTTSSSQAIESLDEIVVTGTRIKRTGFDTLQSAIVTDSTEIERRAYTNVGEALAATPGFGLSDSSPVDTGQGTHSVGQTFVNFFGLGSQRTLTLVNGRRFVSSNSAIGGAARGAVAPGSQVDLNVIPAGLVERVETIAIGGAPVYGSDAIAGTVNIILKDDFEGIQTSAQYGVTEDGDAESKSYRLLMGGNFAEDRGNAVLAVEYNEQAGLLQSDRLKDAGLLSNPADTSDSDGISADRVVEDIRLGVLTDGGVPYNPAGGVPGIVVDGVFPNGNWVFDSAGNPLRFGSNGDLVPYDLGTPEETLLGIPIRTSGGDGFSFADRRPLLAPTERILINGMAHYDVVPWARAFVEASFAHTEGIEQSEAIAFAAPGLLGGPALIFSADNPFLTQQARDTLAANGLTQFQVNRGFNDIIDREPGTTQIDLYRIVTGFEGDFDAFGDRWSWDVSFNYGRSRNESSLSYIDPTRLQNAIDAVRDPVSGEIVCASVAANPNCRPLNLFGANNFTEEARDYVTDVGRGVSTNTQQVVSANLSGHLPFGISDPIAFNIGVERRKEAASFDPDATQEAGILLLGPGVVAFEATAGEFTTEEMYAEIVTPLISPDQNLPIVKSLSVEGAARYVDHSLAGADTTWSAGARFAPRLSGWGDGLLFRGVFTHAIRSPAITELFLGEVPLADDIEDPCDAARFDSGLHPEIRAANCAAALAAVGAGSPAGFNATTDLAAAFGTASGDPDLENEQADSWSIGFVYQPTAQPRLRLALDWSDIELQGGIQSLTIGSLLDACYDSANFPSTPACGTFHRLTAAEAAAQPGATRVAGDIANGFRTGYINTATVEFSGLIFDGSYYFDLRGGNAGSIRLGTTLFFIDKFDELAFAGEPVTVRAGEVQTPKHRANLNLGYTWHQLDVDLQALWRSSAEYDRDATIEDMPYNEVGAYTRFNATVGYQITDKLRAQLAVLNLLDKDPPFSERVERNVGTYDVIGRRYFATLRASF